MPSLCIGIGQRWSLPDYVRHILINNDPYVSTSPDLASTEVAVLTGGLCDAGRQDRALEGAMTFNVTTVMGRRDEPLLEVAARQLAEALSDAGCAR